MNERRLNSRPRNRSVATFFLLVILFSIPIWVIGPLAERLLPGEIPTDLPISSLMAGCPIIAAVILVRSQAGSAGVKRLLKRAFDYRRIKAKVWYLPILFFWPAVTILSFGLMKLAGAPLPDPQLPGLMLPASFAVFTIAAAGEEVGWQGYAIDPLQERWNALLASILVGIVWAGWHIVPFLQMGRTPAWIAWQASGMVAARIITVWLYNNTGRSVFAAILFHAMNNVATVLLPTYGWPYNPALAFAITAAAAIAVTFLWGPVTLSRFRYVRSGREIQPGVAR